MRQVFIAQNPTEAHFVKGMLTTEGIDCFVRGEALFSARGELPLTEETAPSVWITDDSRLRQAQEIITAYERANRSEGDNEDPWTCGSCGEQHGVQFTHCWQCGRARR